MNKNSFGRIAAVVTAAVAPVLAFAGQTFADIVYESQISTTTSLFQSVAGDLLRTALVILGLVLGIAVLIFSVKWGWRKLKSMGMRG